MAVVSKVNPNFPIPGIDQSSKGFRDNFNTIKLEIENIQSKQIILTGEISSVPTILDSGTVPVTINTTGKVYRQGFQNADLAANVLTVDHNLNQQFVIVQVSNDLNQIITPDLVTLANTSQCLVDLTSFGIIAGTWHVVVRG